MAGRVYRLIQELYVVRGAKSNLHFVRAHLVLSGINPDDYDETTQDDAGKIAQLEKMLSDFRGAPGAPPSARRETG